MALASGEAAGAAGQHADLACQDCHLAQPSLTAAGLGPRLLKNSQERTCGGCHRGAAEASHPSGFVPDRALPAEFPLDQQGRMTCATCHDFHGDRPSQLRVAQSGRTFCLSCHEATFFERMPDRGRSIEASGHLDARAQLFASSVDAYSTRCIGCHENNLSLPGDGFRVSFSLGGGMEGANHPIGTDYGFSGPRRRFRPAAALSREILLPGGRVGCLSCHLGYAGQHGAVIETPNGLCQECHDK